MLIVPCNEQLLLCNNLRRFLWNTRYKDANGFAQIERISMFSLLISRPLRNVVAALYALASHFYGLFSVVQEAHATAARFEMLAQMSDAELARRGLKREGLAQAVFTGADDSSPN